MIAMRLATNGRGGGCPRRGFTLVELIVVMIIIAIISATAVSAMSSTPQTRQRVGARLLVRDLLAARERAMSLGTPAWVRVDLTSELVEYLAGATYASALALSETGSGRPWRTRLHTSSDASSLVGVQLGTVNGSSSSPYIMGFDWLGRPTDSSGTLLTSAVTITVTVSGFSTASVVVQPNSGAVTYTLP
ncbi:MAG: prepilin-type N-terminal cleavage/methylation domain-containing protein [Phycisphaerales bacterium]|nr:prepilin-type N-terminal cleavage/methylation domain-containing protein [Phycisphaerales bacterium]